MHHFGKLDFEQLDNLFCYYTIIHIRPDVFYKKNIKIKQKILSFLGSRRLLSRTQDSIDVDPLKFGISF